MEQIVNFLLQIRDKSMDKQNNSKYTLTKEYFLRVLDRAIKPPDQETSKTSEKPDSDYCNEKHTHSNNVGDT